MVGGALVFIGSLLPFSFSDGGLVGLENRGAVFGLHYGGPILTRLSDYSLADNRWAGDAWITLVLGVMVAVAGLRSGRGGLVFIVIVALTGTVAALYELSVWIWETGDHLQVWTEYHSGVGPGPVVIAVGGFVATTVAVLARVKPAGRAWPDDSDRERFLPECTRFTVTCLPAGASERRPRSRFRTWRPSDGRT